MSSLAGTVSRLLGFWRIQHRSSSPSMQVPGFVGQRAAAAGCSRRMMNMAFKPLRFSLLPKGQCRRGQLMVRAAMFDKLSRSMDRAKKLVTGNDKLTAENIKDSLKEIRRALLEADVSLPVVRRFIKKVEDTALGKQVVAGVTPDQQFVKVVSDQLVELMGSRGKKDLEPSFPQIILMAGLQGVGKTTACAKLARYLQKQKKSVLMVATDVYRPAAIDQLQKLGAAIDVPVFEMGTAANPVDIAKAGIAEAKKRKVDAVIVDTAGRLQIDADMMAELKAIKAAINPSDTLLVVDAMTGQEAANLVKSFNDEADITGAILTKMDGDSRGGAALSVREVSGKPIKFVGVGEGMDALEPFYPERMASRILGMGDVLTLVEKAEQAIKEDDAQDMVKRMMSNKFDFNDFLKQWQSVNNMGGTKLMKLLPGFNKVSEKQLYEAEKAFKMYEAMINAMEEEERTDPELLAKSPARRRRVALDSGYPEAEVNNLLGKFTQMRAQMLNMSRMMQLSGGDVEKNKKLMEELIASAQRKVSDGKVRRRRDKPVTASKPAADKSKGFGVAVKK